MCVCVCVCVCDSACLYIYLYVCVNGCMLSCVTVCLHACVCVCVCVFTYNVFGRQINVIAIFKYPCMFTNLRPRGTFPQLNQKPHVKISNLFLQPFHILLKMFSPETKQTFFFLFLFSVFRRLITIFILSTSFHFALVFTLITFYCLFLSEFLPNPLMTNLLSIFTFDFLNFYLDVNHRKHK